jgi:hypothetical protein
VQAANGAILDYGHARRYATRAQARALAARDHGCSFPGKKVAKLPVWETG